MVHKYEEVKGDNRFIYRVLPMVESICRLHDLNVHIKDVIAMVGPFSIDLNIQLIKEFNADHMIMKDSGSSGGTNEKIAACMETGIVPIIIKRNSESTESLSEFTNKMIKIIKDFTKV